MQQSSIEKNLDRKMLLRYRGPLIIIRQTYGGAYIVAEMNGAVLKEKVAAFRLLPHHERYEPISLPENIHELIDLSPEQLDDMIEDRELVSDLAFDNMPSMKPPVDNDDYPDEWDDVEDNVEEDSDSESDYNLDKATCQTRSHSK